MELAIVVLVTSNDEDGIEQTVTDLPRNTDAALVEDAPAPRAGPVAGVGTRTGMGSLVGSSDASISERAVECATVALLPTCACLSRCGLLVLPAFAKYRRWVVLQSVSNGKCEPSDTVRS